MCQPLIACKPDSSAGYMSVVRVLTQFRERALSNECSSGTSQEALSGAHQLVTDLARSGVFRREPLPQKSGRAARALAEVAAEESWEALLQSRVTAVPAPVAADCGSGAKADCGKALRPAAGSMENTASTCIVGSGNGVLTEATEAEGLAESEGKAATEAEGLAETEGKAESKSKARYAAAVASAPVPSAAAVAADDDGAAAAGGSAEAVAAPEVSEAVASTQTMSCKTSTQDAAEAEAYSAAQTSIGTETLSGGSGKSAATSSAATNVTAKSHRAAGPDRGETEAGAAEANECNQVGTTSTSQTPTGPQFDFSNATADREPFDLGEMPFYGKDRHQRLLSAVRALCFRRCLT